MIGSDENAKKAKDLLDKIRRKQADYQNVIDEQEALLKLKQAAAMSPTSSTRSYRNSPTPGRFGATMNEEEEENYEE